LTANNKYDIIGVWYQLIDTLQSERRVKSMEKDIYNPDKHTVISVLCEQGEYNLKQARLMVNTLNKYYGNAGLSAKLTGQGEIMVNITPIKATNTTTRGRRAVSTINIKCGDIQDLISQGKADKEIMALYNIPRATFYRKKKRMETHKDMTRPF
jgi:hypothetical protein